MNKIYKSVYNEKLGTFVAVTEHAKARGKRPSNSCRSTSLAKAFKIMPYLEKLGLGLGTTMLALMSLSAPAAADGFSAATMFNGDMSNIPQFTVMGKGATKTDFHYYSVKSSERGKGSNYNNDGATGTNALAAGVFASAKGKNATAVGYQAKATGSSSVAIGKKTAVSGRESIAIGTENTVTGRNSIAVGTGHLVSGHNSGAFGDPITITGSGSYGVGNNITIHSDDSFVLGSDVTIDSKYHNAVAIGNNAKIQTTSSIAIGQNAIAGAGSSEGGNRSTTIGAFSKAGDHGVTVGDDASSHGYAVAVGSYADASIGGVAIGRDARAAVSNSTALGREARATLSGSVALGDKSVANTDAGIAGYVPTGSSLADVAAIDATTSTRAAVSVGGTHIEKGRKTQVLRQITNVAAGTKDSDVVNVSQLKALGAVVEANEIHYYSVNDNGNPRDNYNNDGAFGADSLAAGVSASAGDHGVAIGDYASTHGYAVAVGSESSASIGGVAIGRDARAAVSNSTALGREARATLSGSVALGDKSVADTEKGMIGYVPTGSSLADVAAIDATTSTRAAVSVGGTYTEKGKETHVLRQITNVAAGTKDSDVVNVAQLKSLGSIVNELADTPLTFSGDSGTDVDRLLGETVNIVGGVTDPLILTDGNIGVVADGSGTLAIKLSKDLDLGVGGSVAIGNAMLDNSGLNVAVATSSSQVGAGFVSVSGFGGTVMMDGNLGTIHGLSNLTFDPGNYTSGQAATEDQLKSVSDVANAGWVVTDAAGNNANIGPNGQVQFVGDTNLTVAQTGADNAGVVEIALNRNLDVDSVTAGNAMLDNSGLNVAVATSSSQVGAGFVSVSGFGGTVMMDGNLGTIHGLSNLTFDPTNYTSGQAATEDQLVQVQQGVDSLGDRAVLYDGNVGDPKDKITLAGKDGTLMTNLADGAIAAGSTDAINGGQIHDMGQSIASGMGGNSKFENGQLITELNVAGNTYSNVNDALSGVHGDLTTKIENVENIANSGWNVTDAAGNNAKIGPNGSVAFIGDSNISVSQTGVDNAGRVELSLNQDLNVNSITAVEVNATAINAGSLTIQGGGPTINHDGMNMGGHRITNVAPGVDEMDAVNLGQLAGVANNLGNQIGDVRRDISRVGKNADAGSASAGAMANLPQAYQPGKSMFAVSTAGYRGQQAYAAGLSTVTGSGKWVFKGSVSGNSRGSVMYGAGVGIQW